MKFQRFQPIALLMAMLMFMSTGLTAAHFHEHDELDQVGQFECYACSSIDTAPSAINLGSTLEHAVLMSVKLVKCSYISSYLSLLPPVRGPPSLTI